MSGINEPAHVLIVGADPAKVEEFQNKLLRFLIPTRRWHIERVYTPSHEEREDALRKCPENYTFIFILNVTFPDSKMDADGLIKSWRKNYTRMPDQELPILFIVEDSEREKALEIQGSRDRGYVVYSTNGDPGSLISELAHRTGWSFIDKETGEPIYPPRTDSNSPPDLC